ncbi:MAG: hemolysin III family protein [Oscillospiraceae bacterium]
MNEFKIRQYTFGEEVFNAVTHGVGALLGIIGTTSIVTLSINAQDRFKTIVFLVYGLALITLYTMSTMYHSIPFEKAKTILRTFDHSTIYLLIAGTYTPLTLLLLRGSVKGEIICAVVWIAAIVGIILNVISVEKFKKVSMFLYVAMGWAVIFAIKDVAAALSTQGFWLLLLGGISYTGGIIFYKQKKRKYMHGVWHLFVLMGSVMHFICVCELV